MTPAGLLADAASGTLGEPAPVLIGAAEAALAQELQVEAAGAPVETAATDFSFPLAVPVAALAQELHEEAAGAPVETATTVLSFPVEAAL